MARPKLNPDTVDKVCPTCNKTFTISFYLRNKRTYCSKKCSNNTPEVIEKMIKSQKKTFDSKYGMHPMKTEKTKNNLRKSVKEKHGVEWASQIDGWYEKVENNNLKKYGVKHYNNIEKIKQTCLEKYGETSYRKTKEFMEKSKKTCIKKYGTVHSSKSDNFKIEHYKLTFNKFLSHPRFINFDPLFSFEEYHGVSYGQYKFRCKRCNGVGFHFIDKGKPPVCPSCDKMNTSYFQKEVYDYIRSILDSSTAIQTNDRTILFPKELDIIVPSNKIAIECNGLVWHSEIIGKKNKVYHINKTKMALSRGYRLLHIFDNEWNNKQDIIKSMLGMIFFKCNNKIHGRKCEIKNIDYQTCSNFLNKNHIQGDDHSSIKLGLYYNEELFSVMTFVKSRFDKKMEWEMSRFCNKLDITINGGASKLFSHFVKTYNPKTVVSYSDRRYFDGHLYLSLGFRFIHNSPPNYHYIIDNYQNIQNRITWQKHKLQKKLQIFDPNLTEWENMKNNGFDRIWDCGNSKWVWEC